MPISSRTSDHVGSFEEISCRRRSRSAFIFWRFSLNTDSSSSALSTVGALLELGSCELVGKPLGKGDAAGAPLALGVIEGEPDTVTLG